MPSADKPKRYQRVIHYIWEWDTGAETKIPKAEYWDGTLTRVGKMTYIVTNPKFGGWPEPDLEELECGHIQPVRQWGKGKFYNNRRRCDQCAIAAASSGAIVDPSMIGV